MEGWVSIYRSLQDHWIWQDGRHLKWWLSILLNVNYEPRRFPVGTEMFTCNKGQSFRSIEQWTDLFSCSKKTTIKFFKMLQSDDMIRYEIVGKGNRRKHLLSVVNWEKYQVKGTEESTERVPETPPKEYSNIPPNNKENNLNKETKDKCSRFSPPTLDEVMDYVTEWNLQIDPKHFLDFYTSNGWRVGKNPMKDWKAALRNWTKNETKFKNNGPNIKQQPDADQAGAERLQKIGDKYNDAIADYTANCKVRN